MGERMCPLRVFAFLWQERLPVLEEHSRVQKRKRKNWIGVQEFRRERGRIGTALKSSEEEKEGI